MAETRNRVALLVDFDNIFGSLLALDRAAAMRFAEEPLLLLAGLEMVDPTRDILVRRAYLNPAGWLVDTEQGNGSGRLYLQKFRPNLVQAGFQVIDCPALTHAQKNAADIRMVLDVVELIEHPTRFDEFIIASGDADFTPVLQLLRAHDRRTTILTAGPTALAYRAVADTLLDDSILIDMLQPSELPGAAVIVSSDEVLGVELNDDEISRRAAAAFAFIRAGLAASSEPVLIAGLGNQLHQQFGTDLIRRSKWFGHGTLSAFIGAADDGFRCEFGQAWDSRRPDATVCGIQVADFDAPPLIVRLARLADLPRLGSHQWPLLFTVLAEYAATHQFALAESTAWAADQMAARGNPIGRNPINFVVRGAMWGGVPLGATPPPSADELRGGFERSVLDRAVALGIAMLDKDRQELTNWLAGKAPRPH